MSWLGAAWRLEILGRRRPISTGRTVSMLRGKVHGAMDQGSSDEAPALEFRMLGPIEVVRSRARIALGGTQQRAVLALLLLDAGHVVTMGQIADALWDGNPRHGSVSTIQTYIFHLREGLEPGRASGQTGT